jgi:CheY-like chemotaxis protein
MHLARTLPIALPDEEILVVDDDPAVRDALCDVLMDEGYRVARAGNGLEALRLLADGLRPALVVLDLTMPVMDGYEFLERRAADPALARLPVIVVSASRDAHRDWPGVAVLDKPIDLDQLLPLVARVFGRAP